MCFRGVSMRGSDAACQSIQRRPLVSYVEFRGFLTSFSLADLEVKEVFTYQSVPFE